MNVLTLHTALPEPIGNTPPLWLHLLPAGEFRGADGRGPYRAADAAAIITASMRAGKLVLDENHATDHAMKTGGSAPAAGWIVELQSRADGIWGRVEWTRSGAKLMGDRAYSGISPAFSAPGGQVDRIHRASLTNAPNLTLTNLHSQEPGMDLAELRRRLGLPETATQADVDRALDVARGAVQTHSQLATAAGLAATATAPELITGITARLTGASQQDTRVAELQTQVTALQQAASLGAATAVIEKAVADGRVIPDPLRTRLIELHQTNPDLVTGLIAGLPSVAPVVGLHTRQLPKGDAQAAPGKDVVDQVAGLLDMKSEDVRKGMGSAA